MHLLQNVVLAEWGPLLLRARPDPGDGGELERIPGFRALTHPLVALPLWLVTYYVWHLPLGVRRGAPPPVDDPPPRARDCYFTAGVLLWWPVFHGRLPSGGRRSTSSARSSSAARSGSCSRCSRTPSTASTTRPRLWGLSALADQQIAGVTMASEQAIVFFAVFAFFLRRFLAEEQTADTFRGRPTVPRV